MKKLIALIGSRRKNGNTYIFAKTIFGCLPKGEFEIEYIFPQDYTILPCSGCGYCFIQGKCVKKDDLHILQKRILSADVFIIASPVYLHYMSADLKKIMDRCVVWTHLLRLEGKPVVVLSTCDSNGQRTVLEPLSKLMTYMGGNVIIASNASKFPKQLGNKKWMDSTAMEISKKITQFSHTLPKSNEMLEAYFLCLKKIFIKKKEFLDENKMENEEVNYWENSGMLQAQTFKGYLEKIYNIS